MNRLRNFFRPNRLDCEIREELEFHRQQTSGSFGNSSLIQEQVRDASTLVWMESIWQDVRFGIRSIKRTPLVSAIAVLSLALGIGANAAIFSLIDRLLLKLLPVSHPEQLVLFRDVEPFWKWKELRQRNTCFTDVAGFAKLIDVQMEGSEASTDVLTGRLVSGNYFSVLGVPPMLGRTLAERDDKGVGAHALIVISDGFWRRRFGRDPGVIGKTVQLGLGRISSGWGTSGFEADRPVSTSLRIFSIVGVMPPFFYGETSGERPDFWTPLTMEEYFVPGRHWVSRRSARWVSLLARLWTGVTLPHAEAATTALNRSLLLQDEGLVLTPGRRREIDSSRVKLLEGGRGFSDLRRPFEKPLWALFAMVGVTLLIACTNLVNLLLAKGAARWREMGTRLALGVHRRRLIQQLLTESFLLAAVGSLLSLPIAYITSRALFLMVADGNPAFSLGFAPDVRVLLFTAALTLLTTFLFGVAPALRSTRIDIHDILKDAGRSTQSGGTRLTGEKAVVVLQVALSTVLLFGTILFSRTLNNLREQDLGYGSQHLVAVDTDPVSVGYQSKAIADLAQQIKEQLRNTPGIDAATYSDNGLLTGLDSASRIRVNGFQAASRQDATVRFDQVGPSYFSTVGVPLLSGREFTDGDKEGTQRVAIINKSLARFFFKDQNPLGQTIIYDDDLKFSLTVVGVSKDTREYLRQPVFRRIYVPYQQPVDGQMDTVFEVKSALPEAILEAQVRKAVRSVAPRLKITAIRSYADSVDAALISERMVARLSVLFGALAVLLGCIGLYGVMAYSVARRTPEIGIRIAIGGQLSDIVWDVIKDSLVITGVGLLAGIPCALLAGKALQSLLFGLSVADGISVGAVTILMVVITLAASIVPARRAASISPMIALRSAD